MVIQQQPFVVGISSVSGGGKTATARKLATLLANAVTLCFDDYDDTNMHPENRQEWLQQGGDYNAWKTPTLTKDLKTLKSGSPITSIFDGSHISPAQFIIFDAPLGRAHRDTGRFIDLMVFIDTPLDVAMARRLLRHKCSIESIKESLSSYLRGGRTIYLHFERQVKEKSDLILDGCLPVDDLAEAIYARLIQKP